MKLNCNLITAKKLSVFQSIMFIINAIIYYVKKASLLQNILIIFYNIKFQYIFIIDIIQNTVNLSTLMIIKYIMNEYKIHFQKIKYNNY